MTTLETVKTALSKITEAIAQVQRGVSFARCLMQQMSIMHLAGIIDPKERARLVKVSAPDGVKDATVRQTIVKVNKSLAFSGSQLAELWSAEKWQEQLGEGEQRWTITLENAYSQYRGHVNAARVSVSLESKLMSFLKRNKVPVHTLAKVLNDYSELKQEPEADAITEAINKSFRNASKATKLQEAA